MQTSVQLLDSLDEKLDLQLTNLQALTNLNCDGYIGEIITHIADRMQECRNIVSELQNRTGA